MMKSKNSLRNRPINSYLSSISKRIEKKSYHEAAEIILLLVRNFGLEKELFSFIENNLNGLVYNDHYRFVKELMNQIEVSEIIIKEFMKDDHREPLNRFTNFLAEYFLTRAQKVKNQSPSETLKCLEIALELKSGDVEISKEINEIKEIYSQRIKATEPHDNGKEYFDKKVVEIKLNLIFKRFCNADNNKEWEEALRIGSQMEALGYSEEVHPIRDRITEAEEELEKITFTQSVNGVETTIGIIKDQLIKKIKAFNNFILKRGKSVLLEVNIDKNLDPVLQDKEVDTHIFEDDSIKIELLLGQYENTLIIKVKSLNENHKS